MTKQGVFLISAILLMIYGFIFNSSVLGWMSFIAFVFAIIFWRQHLIKEAEVKNKQVSDDSAKFKSDLEDVVDNIDTDDNHQPEPTPYRSQSINYASLYKNASLKSVANFTVLDVETTGLGSSDKVVEVAVVKYVDHKPADTFCTLINPGIPIPRAATKIHGITNTMVADAPQFEDICDRLNEFIGNGPVIGHNISFDLRLLRQSGFCGLQEDIKVYDTMQIARRTIEAPNNKLETLCQYYNIDRDQAHRSLSDCNDTAKLFQCLFEEKTGKKIPS